MSGFRQTCEKRENTQVMERNPRVALPYRLPAPEKRPTGVDSGVQNGDVGELGAPIGIAEVARLVGCSVWTVRQRLLPRGLPYFRSAPNGRLIFYRRQVVTWIVLQQQERS